jgi:DNA polymerase III sliding clamp (beta) subunit (PCNA family)
MATATETKTIKFDDLMKVMKKYVSKSEARPVLQLVYLTEEGYFVATDSHHLIRVNKNVVSDIPEGLEAGKLYDPKEMKVTNGNYPDTSRLIPYDYNSTVTIDSNIKEFQQHVKEIKKIVKKDRNYVMKLEFKRNETVISGKYEEDNYSAAMKSMYVEGDEVKLHLSAKYLDIALDTVKKLSKVSYNPIHLGIVSNMRPMVFKQEGLFDIIILPVRIVK